MWHLSWTSYLKIALALAILITDLGVSALVGFALLVCATPIQMRLSKLLSRFRRRVIGQTDKRVKLAGEVFGGIQVVKMFGWEVPFSAKLFEYRKLEMGFVRLA